MKKYKVTITHVLEIEADNACAASAFAKKLRISGPSSSMFKTFSSITSKVSDFWLASRAAEEKIKTRVEAA